MLQALTGGQTMSQLVIVREDGLEPSSLATTSPKLVLATISTPS